MNIDKLELKLMNGKDTWDEIRIEAGFIGENGSDRYTGADLEQWMDSSLIVRYSLWQ